MIQYEHNQHVISHYLLPRTWPQPAEPTSQRRNGGPAVVTRTAGSFEQALIADLSADSLLAIAQGELRSD